MNVFRFISDSVEKTVLNIKGVFRGEYESDIYVWDMGSKRIEQKDIYYIESWYKGKIWIDGIEVNADRAMQIRRSLSQ